MRQILAAWYHANKRVLPWRDCNDPYLIWVSEVILQQTRVDQGLAYYLRFIKRFPDIASLAAASEDEVLKLWEGLGYYSRGRNLRRGAQMLMEDYDGIVPKEYKAIIKIPGIGPYTAAAILSFAYELPYATVDGNVYRVLSRLWAIDSAIDTTAGKKEFSQLAESFLDKADPSTHNQALMEFGALHCTPQNPQCEACPLAGYCLALKLELVEQLPVKEGKTKIQDRYMNYIFVRVKQHVQEAYSHTFIRRRAAGDVWQGLYEIPLIESSQELSLEELLLSKSGLDLVDGIKKELNEDDKISWSDPKLRLKHILSHQRIWASFYILDIEADHPIQIADYRAIAIEEMEQYAFSRLILRAFEALKISN